ncbi:tRNA-dihydrouridine synthase [Candidatus Peregrinibacteria bacterium]|nr:tRNA-dihydrouridine synthase [Candidatus Peregrinibacteria bacterium]
MAPFKGFWGKLKKPIIGLAPMDGITDAPYRHMICKYSRPSLVMTEFCNVEGLARGAVSMLRQFLYSETERPIVAQVYGVEAGSFYKVALMCCFLGFDGIDINMGCPAKKVARRGSGAGMIQIPEHAKKIVQTVKKACRDWSDGITLEEAEIRPKLITALKKMCPKEAARRKLPVSVKTRIGFDEIVTEKWITTLIEEEPANITLHGRTLKQMYLGEANWDEIAKAARLCKSAGISLLGNGDVRSMDDARKKIKKYGVDGVLVGRATLGNPWFFSNHEPTQEERFKVAIEHARYFEENYMDHAFFAMRKHLFWYCRDFSGAKAVRMQLMQSDSSKEVESILLQK